MNRIPPSVFFALAGGLAIAQVPEPSSMSSVPPAVAPTSAPSFAGAFVAEPDEDGTVWVRGGRYKLALGADGVRFQPLFGPRAPRDFPLHLALASARVGAVALPLAPGGAWQRDGDGLSRERGALREHWRAMGGAAQQYFVVPAPACAGALELRIATAGDLVAVDDGPGVRFVAPGLGDVRYSDAVVFDAAGARLDVEVELAAGELVIRVPAAFTAKAAWPLLVDPLVTTWAIDTTVSDVRDARVACEPTSGTWLVVAEEHLSATDVDIVTHRYTGASAPALAETVYAEVGATRSNNPEVGFLAQPQQYVVAWHNATGTGSFQWRTRSATSATLGTQINLSTGIGADLDNRAVIGSALTSDRFLLVMFRKNTSGTDVFGALYRNLGTNFGTLFLGPVLAPAQGTVVPGDISVAATTTDKWVVVWRECAVAGCGSQVVRMQAVATTNGTGPLVPEPVVALATETSADSVRIAGQAGNLLAVWRAFDAGSGSDDVHGVAIGVVGGAYAPLGAVQNVTAQEPNVLLARAQTQPAVSFDGARFVYGYLEDDAAGVTRPHAATVFVSGASIDWHEGHLPLAPAASPAARTFDLAHVGSGVTQGLHAAVWQQDAGASNDVQGAILDARVPGVTSTVQQSGCGLPSEPTIALTGTPALGRTFTVSLGNVTGFPLLLVGPQSFNLLPGCGGCGTGVDLASMQLFLGSSLAVAVPANPALIQFRLAFQGLVGGQAGGCSAALLGFPFVLTDTITAQIL
jgi:hypothetical protein